MKKKRAWAAMWMVLLAAPAGATSLARMNLRRLTAAATAIVRARCVESSSEWQAGEIWTVTRFETLETFKGTLPAQFDVRLLGGKVGGIESIVSDVPRFRSGEEVVLFLEPTAAGSYSVTAWTEGTFRVKRDRSGHRFVTEESAGEEVYNSATRQFHARGIRKMPLREFRRQLHDLVSRAVSGRRSARPQAGRTQR
jgi:hypothetical protein